MTETFERRREYVNHEFGRLTRGKSMTKAQRTKLLKRLWRIAKSKYK